MASLVPQTNSACSTGFRAVRRWRRVAAATLRHGGRHPLPWRPPGSRLLRCALRTTRQTAQPPRSGAAGRCGGV